MSPLWRDPCARATAVLGLVCTSGFLSFVLAWRGMSDLGVVPLQLPWLVSGGLGGTALIGAGIGFIDIHLERRRAAGDRRDLDLIVEQAEVVAQRLLERRARRLSATVQPGAQRPKPADRTPGSVAARRGR